MNFLIFDKGSNSFDKTIHTKREKNWPMTFVLRGANIVAPQIIHQHSTTNFPIHIFQELSILPFFLHLFSRSSQIYFHIFPIFIFHVFPVSKVPFELDHQRQMV